MLFGPASTLEIAFWIGLLILLLTRILYTLVIVYTPLGKLSGYSKENDIPANTQCRRCGTYFYVPGCQSDFILCASCRRKQ